MPYQLCTFCEIRVEKALFNYCHYRHKYILENNGWAGSPGDAHQGAHSTVRI